MKCITNKNAFCRWIGADYATSPHTGRKSAKNGIITNRRGIQVDFGKRNTLSCNAIYGDAIMGNPNNCGILIASSNDNTISCNVTNKTHNGIAFHDVCSNTRLEGNIMQAHRYGLRLSPTTAFGWQGGLNNDNGNIWTGPFTQKAARHDEFTMFGTYFNVDLSRIYSLNPPISTLINPSFLWFYSPNLGSPIFDCSNTCGTIIPSPIRQGDTLGDWAHQVASDSIQFSWYEESERWLSQRALYEQLLQDSVVNDSLFAAFLQNNATSSVGQFSEIAAESRESMQVDSNHIALNDSLLQILHLVSHTDSLLSVATTTQDSLWLLAERDSLKSLVQSITDSLHHYRQNLEAVHTTHTNNILTTNGLVNATAQYEQNEKTINEVYYATIAQEIYTFSPTQLASIIDIAYQCPLAGGTAVYRARAMYSMVNDSVVYDDYEACWNVGINWRQGNTPKPEVPAMNHFVAYPNPAKNAFTLEYSAEYQGLTYDLVNVWGQSVKSITLSKEGKMEVNISHLPSGMYVLKGLTNLRIIIE